MTIFAQNSLEYILTLTGFRDIHFSETGPVPDTFEGKLRTFFSGARSSFNDMKFIRQSFIGLGVICFLFAFTACTSPGATIRDNVSADSLWSREELYFGTEMPGGGTVSDSLWQKFLDEEVTPRFPKGLTVLDASGQYLYENGKRAKEHTKIVILLYKQTDTRNSELIAQVINRYKELFRQESVLRITNRVTAKFQ